MNKTRAQRRRQAKIRKMLLSLSMVLVISMAAVGGTIAWLTAKTDSVVNTFTIGDVNITLTETDGTKGEIADKEFKMIPGETIAKNPKVTVTTGSEPCWLFVKIEESTDPVLDSYIEYGVLEGWTEVPTNTNVWYRKVETSEMGTAMSIICDADEVADQVTVKSSLTKTDFENLKKAGKYPTLTFTAYAVQYDGFEDKPADAWAQAQIAANYQASIN